MLDPLTESAEGWTGGVAAIGNFDGVHLGHARLIAACRNLAARLGTVSVALTFDPPPAALLRPETLPPPLTPIARRADLLLAAGFHRVIVLRTGEALLGLEPAEFFHRVLHDRLRLAGLVEGENFRFGRDRAGDVPLLQRLCESAGLGFHAVPLAQAEGVTEIASSSLVRAALLAGDLERGNRALGRPHRISGTVIEGERRGRTLGFPTANLGAIAELTPAPGVYAGRVHLEPVAPPGEGSDSAPADSTRDAGRLAPRTYAAACHLGPNPTFGVEARKVEIHLLDFTGDLYGRRLHVDLLGAVRPIRKFAGLEEIKAQIALDVERSRALVADRPPVSPAAELARTVREWLALELAGDPTLDPAVEEVSVAVRDSLDGFADRESAVTTPTLVIRPRRGDGFPTSTFHRLHGIETRLRAVFPELTGLRFEDEPR